MSDKFFEYVPAQILKINQLNDTLGFRTGVMIVGETDTSKTIISQSLFDCLNKLHKETPNKFPKINVTKLNPNSIHTNLLYGSINPLTNDWHDGIIATVIREASLSTSSNKEWIYLDGPVDTLWIENLNTVLDDNKMLCLSRFFS